MAFVPISIDNYVAIHMKNNPGENETSLRNRLEAALADYKNGVKCQCGNDIWVIGSASVGNGCFTCITGESNPSDDYEIELAVMKRPIIKGRKNVNDIDPAKISGIFDDDGFEITPELIKKPSLCILCANDDNSSESYLCDLNRYDQRDEKEFKCFAFKAKT
jgi:hypothetical protein